MNDDFRYKIYQEKTFERFEGACNRCGECCGSQDGDPCENLMKDSASGRYSCRVYEERFGPQKTIGGRIFNCVSIRDIMKQGLLRPNCAYNQITSKANAVEPKALEDTKSQ